MNSPLNPTSSNVSYAGTPAFALSGSSQNILTANLASVGLSADIFRSVVSVPIGANQSAPSNLLNRKIDFLTEAFAEGEEMAAIPAMDASSFDKVLSIIKISIIMSEKELNSEIRKKLFGFYLSSSLVILAALIILTAFIAEVFFGKPAISNGLAVLNGFSGLFGTGMFIYVFSRNNIAELLRADLLAFYSLQTQVSTKYDEYLAKVKQ